MQKRSELEMIEGNYDLETNVLKVGHHEVVLPLQIICKKSILNMR